MAKGGACEHAVPCSQDTSEQQRAPGLSRQRHHLVAGRVRAGCVQKATSRPRQRAAETRADAARPRAFTHGGAHAPSQRGDTARGRARAQRDLIPSARLGRKAAHGKETRAVGHLKARDTTRDTTPSARLLCGVQGPHDLIRSHATRSTAHGDAQNPPRSSKAINTRENEKPE